VFEYKWRSNSFEAGRAHRSISEYLGAVRKRTASFRRDEKGTVAILFGLTGVVVMALVGGAVDYGRAVTARDQVQNAVDAAILAGARAWQTEGDLTLAESVARQFFDRNKPHGMNTTVASFTVDQARSALTLTGSASFYAPFLSAAASIGNTMRGLPSESVEYTVSAKAEALLAAGGNGDSSLEIAMMLDVTGSMSNGKIDDLKAAAKDLIDIVVWEDQSQHTSKVALVPFADAVNLGSTTLVNEVRGNLKTGSCTTSTSPCTSFTTGSPSTTQWTTGAPARYYRFMRPDSSYNTWQASSYCVTERIGANRFTDVAPSTAANKVAPLYGSSSASSCGYMTINTNDLEVKTMLKRRIDKLQIAGSTAGQMGTAWAWYMLSPNWAHLWPEGSRPVAYHTDAVQKIAILMTDGEYNTGHCDGIVAKDSGTGSGGNSTKINCNANNGSSNSQAQALCTAMKSGTGITVYTIGFDLDGNQTAINTLRNCASDPSKFYNATDGAALRQAFRDIALQVAKLRLSQ
jgi:Flp pilus assembly protein TadG